MTFNNSILSGTVLARENIQSEGYVAGVSGWIIERDGDAEFNSIVVRGDVISVGVLYTTRILDGEIIIELNSNPVDNVRMNREGFEFNDAGTGGFTLLDYVDGEGLGFRDNSSTRGVYYDNDTGFFIVADSVPWTKEDWINLGFAAGWGNTGAPYSNGQYKLMPDGTVRLRGMIDGPAVADGTLVAGFSGAPYVPPAVCVFPVATAAPATHGGITIDSTGSLNVYGGITSISLEGISFSTV